LVGEAGVKVLGLVLGLVLVVIQHLEVLPLMVVLQLDLPQETVVLGVVVLGLLLYYKVVREVREVRQQTHLEVMAEIVCLVVEVLAVRVDYLMYPLVVRPIQVVGVVVVARILLLLLVAVREVIANLPLSVRQRRMHTALAQPGQLAQVPQPTAPPVVRVYF
jgi:hypothetical protein